MYTWIDNIIYGLNEAYNVNSVYELFDYLNIKIHKIKPNNILLKNNDSFYYRDYLGKEIIFIRDDLFPCIEKFILLHELGHAILHTEIYQAAFNINFLNKNKLEKQANYFAFKMLNINLYSFELEGLSLEQISTYVGIPLNCLWQISNILNKESA